MAYADEVLADSPIGYWPLTDTTGTTAADASGNSLDGTYNGSPALATRTLNAVLGDVADFDGSNDYVSVAAGLIGSSLTAVTLEAWAIVDTANAHSVIVTDDDTDGKIRAAIGLGVATAGVDNSNVLSAGAYQGGWASADTGAAPPTSTLLHLVWTCDGTTGRFYVNGALVDTAASIVPTGDDGLLIGTRWDWVSGGFAGVPWFDGAIGHVAIYSTALSGARISAHYDAGITDPGAGGDEVNIGPVDFEAGGTFDVTFSDYVLLGPLEFAGSGALDAEPIAASILQPIDFAAGGRFGITFRPRGTRRRTVVVDSNGNTYGELGNAQHGPITFELNTWADASFTIGLDDHRSALVLGDEFREV